MAAAMTRSDFYADLTAQIDRNCRAVSRFGELAADRLNWRPAPSEWNVLQCVDHLNLTHDYYHRHMGPALDRAVPVVAGADLYAPSFWGRIYMFFSFNPRFSFPTAPSITPQTQLDGRVLDLYLAKQEDLLALLDRVQDVDLRRSRVPLERGVSFNLGDCLKVLVYHDDLHIGQAQRVLAAPGQAA